MVRSEKSSWSWVLISTVIMTWLGQNKATSRKFGSILLCINCSDCCCWWCKAVCFTTYKLNVLKPIIIAVQWCLTYLKPLITAIQLSNWFLELVSTSTVLEWPSQSPISIQKALMAFCKREEQYQWCATNTSAAIAWCYYIIVKQNISSSSLDLCHKNIKTILKGKMCPKR